MASKGNKTLKQGIPKIKDAFIVIIKTEWNKSIADELEEGVLNILHQQKIQHKTIVVPGAVEIPFAVNAFYQNHKKKADAFITLGCVIKGDTPHFDYVCKAVTDGVSALNIKINVPVIFGVLTVNNEQQAIDRVGGIHGNKGEEAAVAAIKMIALNREISR